MKLSEIITQVITWTKDVKAGDRPASELISEAKEIIKLLEEKEVPGETQSNDKNAV